MKKPDASQDRTASELISERIAELGDWRGDALGRMRRLIREADPDVVEEWKWMGTPVWSHDGIICTGESYRKAVKLTFAKGASLEDPARLFNSSLDGNVRRAIDIHEGEDVDEPAFKALGARRSRATVPASRNLPRRRSPEGSRARLSSLFASPLSLRASPSSLFASCESPGGSPSGLFASLQSPRASSWGFLPGSRAPLPWR